jgi:hypothetical protein
MYKLSCKNNMIYLLTQLYFPRTLIGTARALLTGCTWQKCSRCRLAMADTDDMRCRYVDAWRFVTDKRISSRRCMSSISLHHCHSSKIPFGGCPLLPSFYFFIGPFILWCSICFRSKNFKSVGRDNRFRWRSWVVFDKRQATPAALRACLIVSSNTTRCCPRKLDCPTRNR